MFPSMECSSGKSARADVRKSDDVAQTEGAKDSLRRMQLDYVDMIFCRSRCTSRELLLFVCVIALQLRCGGSSSSCVVALHRGASESMAGYCEQCCGRKK